MHKLKFNKCCSVENVVLSNEEFNERKSLAPKDGGATNAEKLWMFLMTPEEFSCVQLFLQLISQLMIFGNPCCFEWGVILGARGHQTFVTMNVALANV